MKRIGLVAVLLGMMMLSACSKEQCGECFTEETNNETGERVVSSLGELCGEELTNTDGNSFQTVNGTARTYCE